MDTSRQHRPALDRPGWARSLSLRARSRSVVSLFVLSFFLALCAAVSASGDEGVSPGFRIVERSLAPARRKTHAVTVDVSGFVDGSRVGVWRKVVWAWRPRYARVACEDAGGKWVGVRVYAVGGEEVGGAGEGEGEGEGASATSVTSVTSVWCVRDRAVSRAASAGGTGLGARPGGCLWASVVLGGAARGQGSERSERSERRERRERETRYCCGLKPTEIRTTRH
jgi:hypothetical protein